MEWVAAQILELAHDQGVPLHRLAITAPNLETYLPDLRRICHDVLGPGATETGGMYNFSLGPTLAETLLFQAALLPLKFMVAGEQRQDLMAWLQSPFYGACRGQQQSYLHWDMAWREAGVAYGWQSLEKARSERGNPRHGETLWSVIHQALSLLPTEPAPAALWQKRLLELWHLSGFPFGLEPKERGQWRALQDLLGEVAGAAGERPWSATALLEWLSWGAGRLEQTGEGSSEVGIQIQGLLELRGLDFEAVFCLGLNMGVFPPPPRPLPLLSSREKPLVLGGDYGSQREFAETSYRYLLAAAPRLIFTRPLVDEDEERLASPVIPPIWEKDPLTFAALSQPHPAWLGSPAVRAAFRPPAPGQPEDQVEHLFIRLPEVISLSALETALTCPCQFYLSVLLGLKELPDIEPGLPPRDRGSVIHEVLHAFTCRYGEVLNTTGGWDDPLARQYLQEEVEKYLDRGQADPLWQAEFARLLEGEGAVLQQWLEEEKKRFLEGWRWLAMEDSFSGLQIPGWPTTIRGRLDRVDSHQTQGLMLWDYKTGAVPGKTDITKERSCFQLPGYLLAVQQGLTTVPQHAATRAGIIGLKSSREDHLRFEDYRLTAGDWQEVLETKLHEVAQMGRRVGEGDYGPDPSQAPPARNNSCQYCPFSLVCGYCPVTGGEAEA
jgi:RecB family exonuclease